MSVIDCLVKTLEAKNTKVYATRNGQRYLLFECDAKIEIIRRDTKYDALGAKGKLTKKVYIAIIICNNVVYKQEISDEYLNSISTFALTTEVIGEARNQAVSFDNISQVDIDESDNWQFEICDSETAKKLLSI